MRQFAQYFDGLFCLSLPSSIDRRRYMTRQFHTLGIDRYEFFDATAKNDPAVARLYDSGKVACYPPCFRCDELTCGRDDCNNVLIPAQVATFVSFLNLWRHIVDARIETALIVEDDVAFLDYAPRVADAIIEERLLDQLGIRADTPTLLRLGWAAGSDHRASGRIGFKPGQIKMSNPCHAINRAMAAKLLAAFERVDTTVDIFTHKQVGPTVANYTLFPPLASELSWSLGAVDSLIHPKSIRVEYLRKHHPERTEEIEAAIKAIREHDGHILYRPILAIGHPRCGSRYMNELFKAYGLDVGHERMGKDGISSWMFAVEDDCLLSAQDPLSATRKHKYFEHVVHFVRNPRTAIPSIIRENRHSEKSYAFRRKHILDAFGIDLDEAQSGVEKAVLSYLYWNKLIERQRVDLTVRVEDAEGVALRFLRDRRLIAPEYRLAAPPPKDATAQEPYHGALPDNTNQREADWDAVGDKLKAELNAMCRRYDYLELYG